MGKKKTLAILLFLGILPFELNGLWNPIISKVPVLYWVVEVLIWVVLPLVIYGIIRKNRLLDNKEIGFQINLFHKLSKNTNIMLLIGFCILASPVLYFGYKWFSSIADSVFAVNYLDRKFSYQLLIPAHGFARFLVITFNSLTAGFTEEFYYRGVMYNIFKKNVSGKVAYVLISALIFSSVHWEHGVRALFATFLFGVLSAGIFQTKKNIWPLIVGHVFTDYIYFFQ